MHKTSSLRFLYQSFPLLMVIFPTIALIKRPPETGDIILGSIFLLLFSYTGFKYVFRLKGAIANNEHLIFKGFQTREINYNDIVWIYETELWKPVHLFIRYRYGNKEKTAILIPSTEGQLFNPFFPAYEQDITHYIRRNIKKVNPSYAEPSKITKIAAEISYLWPLILIILGGIILLILGIEFS